MMDKHLDKIGERRRIFQRVRGVGIEEPAPVGTQLFNRDLGCDRTHRDGLGGNGLIVCTGDRLDELGRDAG